MHSAANKISVKRGKLAVFLGQQVIERHTRLCRGPHAFFGTHPSPPDPRHQTHPMQVSFSRSYRVRDRVRLCRYWRRTTHPCFATQSRNEPLIAASSGLVTYFLTSLAQ